MAAGAPSPAWTDATSLTRLSAPVATRGASRPSPEPSAPRGPARSCRHMPVAGRNAQLAVDRRAIGTSGPPCTGPGSPPHRPSGGASSRPTYQLRTAAQVADALGNMKGALMKLGQMASYLDDGLPEPVRDALASLQQDAPPMAPSCPRSRCARSSGAPPRCVRRWDPVPIAAASIGQVHRARDPRRRRVAVKCSTRASTAIRADLVNTDLMFRVLSMLFPGLDPAPLVQELRAPRRGARLRHRGRRTSASSPTVPGHPFIDVQP